jgi:Uma2 family endonuclease
MAYAEQFNDERPPLKRKRWTAEEVEHLRQGGFFEDGPKYELLDGKLIEMSPQGPLHWQLCADIVDWIALRLPPHLRIASNGPLRLSRTAEPEPDFFVFPRALGVNDVRGPDTLLVAEVADSSLETDRSVKSGTYAEHEVRLYWVIDAQNRVTWVYTPNAGGYGEPGEVPFDQSRSVPSVNEPLVIADLLR